GSMSRAPASTTPTYSARAAPKRRAGRPPPRRQRPRPRPRRPQSRPPRARMDGGLADVRTRHPLYLQAMGHLRARSLIRRGAAAGAGGAAVARPPDHLVVGLLGEPRLAVGVGRAEVVGAGAVDRRAVGDADGLRGVRGRPPLHAAPG